MTAEERRASISLAAIFGLRMLGMFIILPVFAVYAENLPGGRDHTLVGIALGAYGLTQAILQMPFGYFSDRFGRKPMLYVGLLIFAAGSFLAAAAPDIYWVIAGRILQGAGAVSAVVMALAADLTREQHRTKAMAMIGATIGLTFGLSMVAGPALNRIIGVPGLFALTGVLALAALGVIYGIVPNPSGLARAAADRPEAGLFGKVLKDPELARLNFGILALHAALMALFVVVPFTLRAAGLPPDNHWEVYLPVMGGSFVLMVPPLIWAERKGQIKPVFIVAIAMLLAAQGLLAAFPESLRGTASALLVFFVAFNLLEAMLPSLVSRLAPAAAKGAAIGVYSSVQFLGTFIGAAAGGFLSQHYGAPAVYGFCGVLTALWLLTAASMRPPRRYQSRSYTLPPLDGERARGLSAMLAGLPGVKEARVPAGAGVAYLTVDAAGFDEQNVVRIIAGET